MEKLTFPAVRFLPFRSFRTMMRPMMTCLAHQRERQSEWDESIAGLRNRNRSCFPCVSSSDSGSSVMVGTKEELIEH